jgi:4-hydroxy 2-oxovalerate aldolase
MKILDCTLRDGGYYTNWDFNRKLVNTYIKACNDLPLDYLEVGYRSIPLLGYHGEYFYLPLYVMERLKIESNKKLVVILNEKDIRPENLQDVLGPCIGLIDMVRLAIDPKEFGRALTLAAAVKSMGFEVGFNVMYMSKWKDQRDFLKLLPEVNGIADYFYMVDSYGGVYPNDVKETIQLVRGYNDYVPLGFHGHNNLEMALINTLTAIGEGCDIVDATITGMGRGAGNVKTELLLTALNAKEKLEVDFNPLSKVVDAFSELQKTYDWGTNLPYMVSGAHSLPQKDVMDWVGKRYYSFNSIIRALQNQANGVKDNLQLKKFDPQGLFKRPVLFIGGGDSVKEHNHAIENFLLSNPNIILIHSSSKNAGLFKLVENLQIFCLSGNEGYRLEKELGDELPVHFMVVLPPYPRKMGTYIPEQLSSFSFELIQNRFGKEFIENITSTVLELSLQIQPENLFSVGYDGYNGQMSQIQAELFHENNLLFKSIEGVEIVSLTPSLYDGLTHTSIYKILP